MAGVSMAFDSERRAEIIEEIIRDIGNGIPLREICRRDGFPSHTLVYSWIDADESFALRFAHARADGYDRLADECLAIADDDATDVQRAKLRIETRLKLLAKWAPKKYGEKLELGGPDGGPIKTENVTKITFVRPEKRGA